VIPTGRVGLAGATTMPLSAKDPAHVVRDIAKDPKKNIVKTNLIFFMNIPLESTPIGQTCQSLLSVLQSTIFKMDSELVGRRFLQLPSGGFIMEYEFVF
jgi:hypothetical protein